MGIAHWIYLMKLEINSGIIRGLPLAILVTFLIHGSAIVWWASAKVQDTNYLSKRVSSLETISGTRQKAQHLILERLARIEERISSQRNLLDRIDKNLR